MHQMVGWGVVCHAYTCPCQKPPNGWYTGDFAITQRMAFVLRETKYVFFWLIFDQNPAHTGKCILQCRY